MARTPDLAARCARLRLQAEATLEINRMICNAQDLDQLLMLIAERCRELLQCEVAGFALVQLQPPHIEWRAWSGCRTDYRDVVFPRRGGIAGRVMSSGKPVMLHDLHKRKDAASEFPISFAEGLRSVLGVPLQIMNAPSGCLMIGYRSVHDFTGEEIDALGSFAAQAAIAVENARLYARKTELISLISHELRTPLALIRGCASALLDVTKPRSAALRREYLATIDTESSRLDELVQKLTDVSKLDQGVFDLEMHDVEPRALARAVVARWHKAVPQRRFALRLHPTVQVVRLDRKRIGQVLDNLLSNAVKYSPDDTAITVGVDQTVDSVVFSVADRGPGIPEGQRQRVFERFFRAQIGRRKRDGSGLGLYIARGIVGAHGGRIWLDAKTNSGTTVCFSLPAGR